MSQLCPSSVNAVRIVAVKISGEAHFVGTALRMGPGKSIIDSFTTRGIVGAIDIATGMILADGKDIIGNRYNTHPTSFVLLVGFVVPNWDKALKLTEECAKMYCINYIGWDIAIRENDAILVEANIKPMAHVYQVAGNGGKWQDIPNY